jgi:hypothetical protein
MRSLRFSILFAVFLLLAPALMLTAAADHEWDHRYAIQGTVTDSAGNTARFVDAAIDCSSGASDPEVCEHNEGRSASTGLSGEFELDLHIHAGNDGLLIVLDIDGEKFNHTIDLRGEDDQAKKDARFADLTFELDHEVDNTALYATVIASIIAIALLIGFFVKRRRRKHEGISSKHHASFSSASKTVASDLVGCPRCDARLKHSNLKSHLMKKHYLKAEQAVALIGDEEE